jgi:hypothetical protein
MELEDITFSSEGEESHEPAPASAPAPGSNEDEPSRNSGSYQPEMDEMRCVLYAHGGMDLSLPFPVVLKTKLGGYYFGSVDQERSVVFEHPRTISPKRFLL